MTLVCLWVSAVSAASDPAPLDPVDDGQRVHALVWARAVIFDAPVATSIDGPTTPRGWIVELRADRTLLGASQQRAPILFAGDQPILRFNYDDIGGCAVGFVPGDADLANTPLFFGSAALPERLDDERRSAEVEAALAQGVRPRPADEVARALAAGGPPLAARDLRDAHAVAMERVALCTASPSDLRRSGIPSDAPTEP